MRSAARIFTAAPRYGSVEQAFNSANVSPNLSQRCLFSREHMLWWGLLIQQK